jgi:hypothetical protein
MLSAFTSRFTTAALWLNRNSATARIALLILPVAVALVTNNPISTSDIIGGGAGN